MVKATDELKAYSARIVAGVAEEVLAILERHPDGASLGQAALCEELQCSYQVLQRAVAKLQRDGHPVLSDRKGFYLARSRDEVMAYVATLRRRAEALREVADALAASVEG